MIENAKWLCGMAAALVVFAGTAAESIETGDGAAGEPPLLWPPPVGVAPEIVRAIYSNDPQQTWPMAVETPLGTVVNGPAASVGFTLFSNGLTGTHLIDNAGRVVHHWEQPLENAKLLPNGNLMGKIASLYEIDRQSNRVWEYKPPMPLHHDYVKLPNGNVLLLLARRRSAEEAIAAGANPAFVDERGLVHDVIIEVRPSYPEGGKIVWQWSVWDHLIQDFDPKKDNYGDVAAHPGRVDINYALAELSQTNKQPDRTDWTYANALSYHAELDHILISARNFSEIWVVAHGISRRRAARRHGDLLWRWGNPRTHRAGTKADQQLFWPHAAHWIPPGLPGAGNILIFNNGDEFERSDERGYSEVLEIEYPLAEGAQGPGEALAQGPAPAQTVWRYVGDPPRTFFSQRTSSAQRLDNGNTLVLAGLQGTMFEVTPSGEMVWKYINPLDGPLVLAQGNLMPVHLHPSRQRVVWANVLFRVYKYAADHPGLQGLDLTPKGKLERPRGQRGARFDSAEFLPPPR